MDKPKQTFRVSIRTRTPAFQGRASFELAFQLRKLASFLEANPTLTGTVQDIHDRDGRKCGSMTIDHTDS